MISLNSDGWQENVLDVQPDGVSTDWWAVRNQWLWKASDDVELLEPASP